MRKLVALEPAVYEKLKEGAGRIESRVLGDLDRQMQTVLHSQQPEHEKINLYNSILEKAARYEKKTADGKPQATEDRILADFEQQMQNILHSQKPPREKMLLYNNIFGKSKVYQQKRRTRRVQKKEKLPKKEILKHFKKAKNKKVKRILKGIEEQKNISWNDAGNLVLDGRPIPSSNITELLRSAVVKKEPNIPGWQSFDSVLPWESF